MLNNNINSVKLLDISLIVLLNPHVMIFSLSFELVTDHDLHCFSI